jgi:plastocyanin
MNYKKGVVLAVSVLAFPLFALAHGASGHGKLIIRMTNNGFEPQEITITEGDEVFFLNDDDVDRWPASNLHPTHGLYPEFDPLKGMKPGDSWSFVFDKSGVWRMHDHLIPSMTGTITVEEGSAENSQDEFSEEERNKATDEGFLNKLKAFLMSIFGKLFGKE